MFHFTGDVLINGASLCVTVIYGETLPLVNATTYVCFLDFSFGLIGMAFSAPQVNV